MRTITTNICSAAITLALCLAGCSSDNQSDKAAPEQQEATSALISQLGTADVNRVSAIADSLALDVDDLTNDETIAVLNAYVDVYNKNKNDGKRKKALETMRKYVDVYMLSMQRDSKGMKKALESALRKNHDVDLASLYTEFRSRLTDYDAGSGAEDVTKPEGADSAAIDSAKVAVPATAETDLLNTPAD